jgi:hypothetical protein
LKQTGRTFNLTLVRTRARTQPSTTLVGNTSEILAADIPHYQAANSGRSV